MAALSPVAIGPLQHKKKRKSNFTSTETAVLVEQFEANKDILTSKLTNQITNSKKKKIWHDIASAVNAVGQESRTENDVKEKWKSMKCNAKRSVAHDMREARKTGGGVAQPPAENDFGSITVRNKISDMFRDSASFIGVTGGLETYPVGTELTIETSPVIEIASTSDNYSGSTINNQAIAVTEEDDICQQIIYHAQLGNMISPELPHTPAPAFIHLGEATDPSTSAKIPPSPPAPSIPSTSHNSTNPIFRNIPTKITQQQLYQQQFRVLLLQEQHFKLKNEKLMLETQKLKEN